MYGAYWVSIAAVNDFGESFSFPALDANLIVPKKPASIIATIEDKEDDEGNLRPVLRTEVTLDEPEESSFPVTNYGM